MTLYDFHCSCLSLHLFFTSLTGVLVYPVCVYWFFHDVYTK